MTAPPTAPPRSAGRHPGTAELISEDDLPIARTEIELSAPPRKLVLAEPSTRTRKILALVRLHTHPLGIVMLDGRIDRTWAAHAPTVWSTMQEAINAHLAADGLPPADNLESGTRATYAVARCLQRRA